MRAGQTQRSPVKRADAKKVDAASGPVELPAASGFTASLASISRMRDEARVYCDADIDADIDIDTDIDIDIDIDSRSNGRALRARPLLDAARRPRLLPITYPR